MFKGRKRLFIILKVRSVQPRKASKAIESSGVAFAGSDILVSASEDPFSAHGAIYRRSIEGRGPLQPIGGGLPEWTDGKVDTGCLASHGSAVAAADGHLYVSEDGGRSWLCSSIRMLNPSGLLLYA